jgi:hypothetical protein
VGDCDIEGKRLQESLSPHSLGAKIMAIESIVGPVIGAVVAVSAIWIKELLERRKNSQLWFEDTYIRQGIDQLLEYLRLYDVQLVLLLNGRDVPLLNESADTSMSNRLPIEALVKIETLLRTKTYTQVTCLLPGTIRFFIDLPSEKRSKVLLTEKINFIRTAYESLLSVRQQLLNFSINEKSKVHTVSKNAPLRHIVDEFEKYSEEYIQRTEIRGALIDLGR